jgi:hypothetical protein
MLAVSLAARILPRFDQKRNCLSYGLLDRVVVSFARAWLTLPASSGAEAWAMFSTSDTPRVA